MALPGERRVDAQHRARTACPRCSTPSPRPATTTARRSPGISGQHHLVQHRARPGDAARPVPADRLRARRWPARWPRSSRCPTSAGTLPTYRPLFVGMLVGVTSSSSPSPTSPRSRSARSRKACTDEPPTMTLTAAGRRRTAAPGAAPGRAAGCSTPSSCCRSTARRAAQARPARRCGATRSCSSSRSARSSPPCWRSPTPRVFAWLITVWLWLTVLFANLAEAVAEGRGKAQAETLRRAKQDTMARRLTGWQPGCDRRRRRSGAGRRAAAGRRRRGRGRPGHPRRRRRRRGHRQRRRVGDHR